MGVKGVEKIWLQIISVELFVRHCMKERNEGRKKGKKDQKRMFANYMFIRNWMKYGYLSTYIFKNKILFYKQLIWLEKGKRRDWNGN